MLPPDPLTTVASIVIVVPRRRRFPAAMAISVLAVALLIPACGSDDSGPGPAGGREDSVSGGDWPHANFDLAGTRTASGSSIDSSSVDQLEVAWSFEVPEGGAVGALATSPVIIDGVVWVSDLNSNIYGIDLADGSEVIRIDHGSTTFGPNGVAVGSGLVFAAPDSESVAAFSTSSGEQVWRNPLTEITGGAVNIQPLLVEDMLLVATSSLGRPGARGTLFALEATSGEILWQFDTIESPDLWGRPDVNGGGGSWYPPTVDLDARRVYWGTANPYPWPGTADFPNGSSRPGDNRWTNSTLALDLDTGALLWGRQHRPHDLFDLDTALTALTTAGSDG